MGSWYEFDYTKKGSKKRVEDTAWFETIEDARCNAIEILETKKVEDMAKIAARNGFKLPAGYRSVNMFKDETPIGIVILTPNGDFLFSKTDSSTRKITHYDLSRKGKLKGVSESSDAKKLPKKMLGPSERD